MTKQELLDFLKANFTPIDNIPEDTAWRDAICMEARASLLIEANCTSERFPAFMQCGRHTEHGWVYKFAEPFRIKTYDEICSLQWCFKAFQISNSEIRLKNSHTENFDRWTLNIGNAVSETDLIDIGRLQLRHCIDDNFWEFEIIPKNSNYNYLDFIEHFEIAQKEFNYTYRSRFLLCQMISPYNTPEKVCRFWENSTDVFDQLKMHGIHLSRFYLSQESNLEAYLDVIRETLNNGAQYSQENLLQYDIKRMVPCAILDEIIPKSYHYYKEWYCSVFPFKDEHGDTPMQLLKLYDWEKDRKVLIPVTVWSYPNSSHDKIFCVPLPVKKQPLYNLDLLSKTDVETIILTDSVELADSNQRNAPDGVVFTSFICSQERYEQVDWSPLEDKEIYYLISNHSKVSLEEAVIKAEQLNTFFTKQNLNIQLKFIVLSVNYPQSSYRCFWNVDEFISYYNDNSPKAETDLLMILDTDDFKELYDRANIKIASRDSKWWLPDTCIEQQVSTEKETDKRRRPPYLLRPFLLRGEVSMLYASKSTGKSALALSMAAAVVSGETLFDEKWWVVPKIKDDPFYKTAYPYRKVLYLDFENGAGEIRERKIDFARCYWPSPKNGEEWQKCNGNLIVEDMTKAVKDYSRLENWEDINILLEKAKAKGISGQPVDLLVIDTVSKFIRNNYTPDMKLSELINYLRGLNIAVLLIHHEGSNNEVRGWKSVTDDMYFLVRLFREQSKEKDEEEEKISEKDAYDPKTLKDSLTLAFVKARSGIEAEPPFDIYFDKVWKEYHADENFNLAECKNKEFKRIVKNYSDRRLIDNDIFPILGISHGQFTKLKKEVGLSRTRK